MIKTIWVMYTESTRDGKPFHRMTQRSTQTCQHCGYPVREDQGDFEEQLDRAKTTVLRFRDLASQGKHFLNERQTGMRLWPNLVLGSAWIEVERRERMDF